MRIMTFSAICICYVAMRFLCQDVFRAVTFVANLLSRPVQQVVIKGEVRAVANHAFACIHRRMKHFEFCSIVIMALVT